jgi:hypothetical protein
LFSVGYGFAEISTYIDSPADEHGRAAASSQGS